MNSENQVLVAMATTPGQLQIMKNVKTWQFKMSCVSGNRNLGVTIIFN